MTEPDGKPHRRRRRPHRPAGPESLAAGTGSADVRGGVEPPPAKADAAAQPHQQADPAGGSPEGKQGRGHGGNAEPAKGRRDGEPGRAHGRDADRGWRELAGSSPSQVGLSGAMRARDVARPTPADLAAAERSVTVIRRHWQPPESTP
jgi:hypothetical protein